MKETDFCPPMILYDGGNYKRCTQTIELHQYTQDNQAVPIFICLRGAPEIRHYKIKLCRVTEHEAMCITVLYRPLS